MTDPFKDVDGYRCTDARLGKYLCCGQKDNPEFVCWEPLDLSKETVEVSDDD